MEITCITLLLYCIYHVLLLPSSPAPHFWLAKPPLLPVIIIGMGFSRAFSFAPGSTGAELAGWPPLSPGSKGDSISGCLPFCGWRWHWLVFTPLLGYPILLTALRQHFGGEGIFAARGGWWNGIGVWISQAPAGHVWYGALGVLVWFRRFDGYSALGHSPKGKFVRWNRGNRWTRHRLSSTDL